MYIPNNTPVYLRAFSGFLAGITSAAKTDISPADYTLYAEMADAYAQQFDTSWGVGSPTNYELLEIDSASEAVWENSSVLPSGMAIVPGNYTQVVLAVIARVQQGNAQIIAEGIDPNAAGGGGGTGTVTSVTASAPLQVTGTVGVTPNVKVIPAGVQSEVIVWDGGVGGSYSIRQLTQDDIAAGFSITGFSGGSTVEIGASVVNPAFAASYSSLPASAQITNTDGIDSPLALVSPFTAGTVVGTFTHGAQATVGFTLTAVGSTTKTAGQNVNFFPRSFGGVATAGATSATASGVTAVLNGGAGTLANAGLAGSVVGQTFGPFAPSSQKIDVLVPHTASPHTWKDPATGFAFAMNAPTTFAFTNAQGAVVSMDLYESTNILVSGAQSVTCAT